MIENIEIKIKQTLKSLEQVGFDTSSYESDLNEQENIEDYEEIYNSLTHHIECLEGIKVLNNIEAKIFFNRCLEELISDMLKVLSIFRENRKLLNTNKDINEIRNNLYNLSYQIITKEIINSLNSTLLNEIEKDEFDKQKLNEVIYKEIKVILNSKEKYDKNLIDALEEKLTGSTKEELTEINKEIILLVVIILHKKEIMSNKDEITNKLRKVKTNDKTNIIFTEEITESLKSNFESIKSKKSKNTRKISTRLSAFLASIGIIGTLTGVSFKMSNFYTKYETTVTVATRTSDNFEIKVSDPVYAPKISEEDKNILRVFYQPFETTSGMKQYVEDLIIPETLTSTSEIYEALYMDIKDLPLHSSELISEEIYKSAERQVILKDQNLEKKEESIPEKIVVKGAILSVMAVLSLLPYMPINDLKHLQNLLKNQKKIDEEYYKMKNKIEDYLKEMNNSLSKAEEEHKTYEGLKELYRLLNIEINNYPQVSKESITTAKEKIKTLQK